MRLSTIILLTACPAFLSPAAAAESSSTTQPGAPQVIFATFAETPLQIEHIMVLAESIRTFAGVHKAAPIWVFMPDTLAGSLSDTDHARFAALDVTVRTSGAPEESLTFFYSRKVFAAAQAETEAVGKTTILVWMDDDTVVLREPTEFALSDGIALGYRPVMHKLIGSLYAEPPDSGWARVYSVLSIPEAAIFPMTTVADQQVVRPYFNAGLLVVHPESGILRKWAEVYPRFYSDSLFLRLAEQDQRWRVFLHQIALSGAVLATLKPNEMTLLSEHYNYPIFFNAQFGGATQEFDDIGSVVTLRHEAYFRKPDPKWRERLKGSPEVVNWLGEHLQRK